MSCWREVFQKSLVLSPNFQLGGANARFLPCRRPWFWRTTSSKLFAWVQCKSAPTMAILFVCSATMLTSKLITEIIGNHSQFYVCANSCKKIVSSRSWQIMKLLMNLICKGTCAPFAPLSKGRGRCPVMHPRSGVPVPTSSSSTGITITTEKYGIFFFL